MEGCGLGASGLEWGLGAGSCEHSNEPLGNVLEGGGFLV